MKKNRLRIWLSRHRIVLRPTQIIALIFVGIILAGAALLSLPAASKSGVSCGFLPALFTATSSTCVTGLVLFDTGTQWTMFGQAVILCLIEVGGLGFMSMASLVIFALRRKVGLRHRMLMAQALSVNEMEGVVNLQKWVLGGSLGIQAVAATVLFIRFIPQFGPGKALWDGLFHAVSAFCNAGFDVFGYGDSLVQFNSDPVVCITLMILIAVGGLGFFVWEEVARVRRVRKFSVYTKLVLIASLVLTLGGAALLCVLEWNNPATLGNMNVADRIMNGFFQAVTARTAGFDSIGQGAMTDAGKAASMMLMIVGGSSGSTAGGIKTVTVVVILLFLWSRARGRSAVCVFKKTVPSGQVMDAMTVAGIVLGLAFAGGLFISATSDVSLTDGLYEAVSAIATVGLTTGITPNLSVAAKILVIVYMYFGRVGVLTISLGFMMGDRSEERFRYAQTNLLIG